MGGLRGVKGGVKGVKRHEFIFNFINHIEFENMENFHATYPENYL